MLPKYPLIQIIDIESVVYTRQGFKKFLDDISHKQFPIRTTISLNNLEYALLQIGIYRLNLFSPKIYKATNVSQLKGSKLILPGPLDLFLVNGQLEYSCAFKFILYHKNKLGFDKTRKIFKKLYQRKLKSYKPQLDNKMSVILYKGNLRDVILENNPLELI